MKPQSIALACEQAFGRHEAIPQSVSGVDAKAHENDPEFVWLKRRLEDFTSERCGVVPHLLLAKMGHDGHDLGAEVIATANGDIAFRVDLSVPLETPSEIAERAIAASVDVIGVSSLAVGHRTLVSELNNALRDANRADIKVVCGGVISEQDHDFLRRSSRGRNFRTWVECAELGRVSLVLRDAAET